MAKSIMADPTVNRIVTDSGKRAAKAKKFNSKPRINENTLRDSPSRSNAKCQEHSGHHEKAHNNALGKKPKYWFNIHIRNWFKLS